MEFLMLPDDVLLMVLGELNERATFACRLVCKRLAALTLHPDLWRHRSASSGRCSCPPLRLAPCLDKMYIVFPLKGCSQWAFASTRCAAKRLFIYVKGSYNAVHAAAVVSKQEKLGRLIDADVYMEIRPESVAEINILLGMLASTTRLERLRVAAEEGQGMLSTSTVPILGVNLVTSSIRDFECRLSVFSEPFVNFVLSEHAATLETVHLRPPPSSWKFTSTALLLGSVTNLSQLTCCSMPGMEALAACKSLRVLELTVHTNTESMNRLAVSGVAKLLRRAEHLRKVSLQYEPAVCSDTDVGAELVLALASGRSRVETVIIQNYVSGCGENSPLHRPVVSALPSLPALRRLKLYLDNPDKILLAISPDVAPALQKVELRLGVGCPHSWIHGDTVKSVFTLNPTLHVHLLSTKRVCFEAARCQACELDCHAKLRAVGWFYHWFFSHDPTHECSVKHTPRSEDWIHLPL